MCHRQSHFCIPNLIIECVWLSIEVIRSWQKPFFGNLCCVQGFPWFQKKKLFLKSKLEKSLEIIFLIIWSCLNIKIYPIGGLTAPQIPSCFKTRYARLLNLLVSELPEKQIKSKLCIRCLVSYQKNYLLRSAALAVHAHAQMT